MRHHRSSAFTQSRVRLDFRSTPVTEPEPRTFTPAQQLAMMILRRSEITKAVVAALYRSTVKAGEQDFQFLVDEKLAKHNGARRELTPMGCYLADSAAREMAKQLNLPILRTGGTRAPGCYQRQWHTHSWTQ